MKNGWLTAGAVVLLAAGVALSRLLEHGVHVESVTLAGDVPALRFASANAGPCPVAVLAHGVTASKETLFRFSEALAAAGFLCVAVDLPGHGASGHRFAPGENASTLERVAAALGRVDVFLGHSMGAGAGAESVRRAGLRPQLFIAVGALPNLGSGGPPLLLLAGRWEEAVPTSWLKEQTNARLVLSAWSDHALEPYDPQLVNAAVETACVAVGRPPPSAPTRWRWRLAGLGLALLGALVLALSVPARWPQLAQVRGVLVAGIFIAAIALTAGTWVSAAPHLRRVPVALAVTGVAWLVIGGAGRLKIPRWSFPALAAAAALGCGAAGAYFLALFAGLFAGILFAGTVLGFLATRGATRRQGDIAMAIIVGYAIGQWMPTFY
jgi:pimeloyl-ACP methyl ester carboxylesterase